jgi:hypothetical protein
MKQILPEEPLPIAFRYIFVSDAAVERLDTREFSKTSFVGSVLKYLNYRWPDRAAVAKGERVIAHYFAEGGEEFHLIVEPQLQATAVVLPSEPEPSTEDILALIPTDAGGERPRR